MPKSATKKRASSATSKSSRRKKPALEKQGKRCDTCNRWKTLPRFRLISSDDPRIHAASCLICEAKRGDIPSDPKEYGNQKIRRDRDAEKRAKIQQELAYRELCRRKLLTYVQRYEPSYLAGWVHHKMAAKLEEFLEKCVRGESPRLMLFLPPRHGKSMLASDYFVSWAMGKYPWLEFISTSHSSGLPIKASRRIRSRMQHQSHQTLFEDTKIAHDSRNVEHWNTTANGGFLAAGVGGGITGHGAHCAHFSVPCTTRRGILPIEQVCVGDEVWGYDHDKGAECWTRVEAVSTRYKDHLVSAGGAWVTPDHQVWTEEYGYIEAARADGCTSAVSSMRGRVPSQGEVAQTQPEKVWRWRDDVLFPGVRQSTSDEAGMRLREKESPARGILRSMLPTGQARSSTVCAVRRYVQTQYSRARAQCSQAWGAFERLLFPSLLRSVPQSEPIAGGSTEPLSGMWDRHTGGTPAVLQQGMLLQPGEETPRVRRRMEYEQTQGRETRRLHVHELWPGEGPDGGASHRSRRNESFNGQSDPSLRTVPQPLSSSVYGVCAAGLAGALPKTAKHRVVDIQTGTGNFFANEILVHNCFIIDDPVKDAEEADSETVRENHWDWWSSTASTRIAPGGGCLYIATRWHDDDLGGRMLSQEREAIVEGVPEEELENWEVISFPALAEEDEYELPDGTFMGAEGENYPKAKLIRRKDEALHRDRWPEEFLRRKRRTMQPRHWSALYQQNPVPDEGITFTKDMFITQAPRIGGHNPMILLSAWDLAIGKNAHNDWTVGVVGGLDSRSNLHILDMVRGRWGTMQICEAILDMYAKYPEIQRIGIERGQLELAIKEPLESRMDERKLWPVIDRTLTPIQDKERRAGPLQGMMQHHRVMFPPERDFPWVTRIREEMLRFPAGVHDDTVDAHAWLARMAYKTTPPKEPAKPRYTSWKEQLKQHVAGSGTKDPMAA